MRKNMNEECKKLVETIDTREKDKTDEESREDWSKRVEKAVKSADENIKAQIEFFRHSIPDPSYADKKLEAFNNEITRINAELSVELKEEDINLVVADILDSFNQSSELSKLEEEALGTAAEQGFLSPFFIIEEIENRELYEKHREKALQTVLENKGAAETFEAIVRFNIHEPGFFKKEYVVKMLKEVTEMAIKNDPLYWLIHFEDIKDLPNSELLLETIVVETSKKSDAALLKHYHIYKGKIPDYEKYVEEVLLRDIKKKRIPGLVNFFSKHPELRCRKKILKTFYKDFAYKSPGEYVKYYGIFNDLPGAEKLYKAAKTLQYINPYARGKLENANDGRKLLSDPALKHFEDVKREWLPELSDREFVNMATFISRNLYFKEQKISDETVKEEYQRILEQREKYGELPVFYDRNILLLSHIERYKENGIDRDRFGQEGLVNALVKQKGDNDKVFQHIEAKNYDELSKVKDSALNSIEEMGTPFTFFMDGHGSPDAIYLSDGQASELVNSSNSQIIESDNTVKISYKELAKAIAKRSTKYGEQVKNDIYIFSGCFNYQFIRKLYKELKNLGANLPIALGASEYKQYSYSTLLSDTGSAFFDKILKVESEKTLLKDIWQNEFIEKDYSSNPSLFILSEEDMPAQISQNSVSDFRDAA